MKHGPIALIDEHVPFVVAAPSGALLKNCQQLRRGIARGGRCIVLSDAEGLKRVGEKAEMSLKVPKAHSFAASLVRRSHAIAGLFHGRHQGNRR